MTLDVIHADAAIVVLNKPPGLLSVPGRGADKQDCLHTRMQSQYPDALVVHRLDMATSGLIIFARNKSVQRTLGDAFAAREVHKRYEAVVSGRVCAAQDDWQVIDLPIVVDWPNRPLRIIDPVHGRPSVTRMRCLGHNPLDNTSRVALEPVTGRSHQLRVHMQAIRHCILGDALYATAEVLAQSPRLLLHASQLALRHPLSGTLLEFNCPAGF
ncbi:MAG: RNA pseudouridine synthase [Burkholderiales bacterium]|nr:RNA pseudouridine synthase [Burkholderiales bacterium]